MPKIWPALHPPSFSSPMALARRCWGTSWTAPPYLSQHFRSVSWYQKWFELNAFTSWGHLMLCRVQSWLQNWRDPQNQVSIVHETGTSLFQTWCLSYSSRRDVVECRAGRGQADDASQCAYWRFRCFLNQDRSLWEEEYLDMLILVIWNLKELWRTHLQPYEQPQDNSLSVNEGSDYTTRPWAMQIDQHMDQSQDAAITRIFPTYHAGQLTNTP